MKQMTPKQARTLRQAALDNADVRLPDGRAARVDGLQEKNDAGHYTAWVRVWIYDEHRHMVLRPDEVVAP